MTIKVIRLEAIRHFLLQAKNPTNVVHVCEASIDVLSYASLMKLYQKDYETIQRFPVKHR